MITVPSYKPGGLDLPLRFTLVSILPVKPPGKSFSSWHFSNNMKDMQKTTILQFTALEDLMKFKGFIQTENVEINFNSLTISCQVADEEFDHAVASYSVTILYRGEGMLMSNKEAMVR
jgi:hypothetical protein